MNSYRIITFDGGGIRGALTAALLQRLTTRFPELIDRTDLFAGTSTGSFIALGLASGISPAQLVELYSETNAAFIFSPRHWELVRPKYDHQHLKQLLSSMFPADLRLKDLPKRVLVPSFQVIAPDAGTWGPVLFNNFPNSDTQNALVIDAALSSSAAPTFFPSYQNHIDGGVIANNPSQAAIAMARDVHAGNQELDNVCLLSIGTGFNPHQITSDTTHWGAMQWAFYPSPPSPLLNILFDGVVEVEALFSTQLLGNRCFRLNPLLPKPIALDDYDQISVLTSLAENLDLEPAVQWISRNWL